MTKVFHSLTGVYIALLIILLWGASLWFNLTYTIDWTYPLTYVLILVQMHLFTGLFITAHDAMHNTVAPGRKQLNRWLGIISANLFVFNSYAQLRPKHHQHHKFAGTERDPDFHRDNANFFLWFWDFIREYITWKQILLAAITFNLLKLVVPQTNLILYWIIPSILSLLQLFFFGTFMPHMGEHAADNRHKAHTQQKNHLWAFLSCYFFGYHYEHHDSPGTPWWRLWQMKG